MLNAALSRERVCIMMLVEVQRLLIQKMPDCERPLTRS